MNDFAATIKVSRPPAAVRAALTSTDALTAWWTPVTGDGEQGGELAFAFGGIEAPTVMRVDEASTDRVAWTCVSSGVAADWIGTEISYTLEALNSGTVIFFRHQGLTPALECFDMCYSGWTHYVQSLAQFVETGIGMPNGSSGDRARRAADADPALVS